jgi:hypothetical protein
MVTSIAEKSQRDEILKQMKELEKVFSKIGGKDRGMWRALSKEGYNVKQADLDNFKSAADNEYLSSLTEEE